MVPLQCGLVHKYCSECYMNLIKITRVKKGLVHRFKYEDAIKCPQCSEIVLLSSKEVENLKHVVDCQEHRDKQRKAKESQVTKPGPGKTVCQMCRSL